MVLYGNQNLTQIISIINHIFKKKNQILMISYKNLKFMRILLGLYQSSSYFIDIK